MNYSRVSLTGGRFVDTDWDHQITTVRISDTRFGVTASGNAKLHPDDTFDLEIGYRLAATRAEQRLLRKVERKITRDPSFIKKVR